MPPPSLLLVVVVVASAIALSTLGPSGAAEAFVVPEIRLGRSTARSVPRPRGRADAAAITQMRVSYEDMLELDDSNYRDVLGGGGKAVLLDVSATWCGPCKLIEPVLERASDKWARSVEVVRFNVDSSHGNSVSDLKADLLSKGVSITALPALVLFKDGKVVASRSGVVKDLELNIFLSVGLNKARSMGADGGAEEAEEEVVVVVGAGEVATAASKREAALSVSSGN